MFVPSRPEAVNQLPLLEAILGASAHRFEVTEPLREILIRVREVLKVDTATVLRYDARAGQLVAMAAAGLEEEVYQGVRVAIGSGFAGQVAARREPVILDRVDETTVVNPLLWEYGLHVLLGVPLLAGSELVGVLHVGSIADRHFTHLEIGVLQLLAERLALSMQTEVLSENRVATMALQRSLLPGRLPRVSGLEFAARYIPGADAALGGDWYDVFPLPDDRLGIVMGDVAGHGLEAAVIMGRLRSALRAYALDCEDPAEVLGKLDRKANHFEHGVMATVAYGVVDVARESLALSLAGHPPPVLAVPGEAGRLVPAPPDPPIGVAFSVARRRVTKVGLPPGAVLAFYTDGLVERRDEDLDDRLHKLETAVEAGWPERVSSRIMTALIGARPARDDVALLIVRRLPG
jgi:serine phosphatase RsbU (regulator of sigma subunit)